MLYIFGGLPGSGKSTLAARFAAEYDAVYGRIDTIEQAMRDAGVWVEGPAGYVVAYSLASDNLRLGLPVVVDSVNPLPVTRDAWREVAKRLGQPFVEIEVVCSDEREHRRRVESRSSDIPGHTPPTWDEVQKREYHAWEAADIVIDTASRTLDQSVEILRQALHHR
jgi:predicted kinase